jgi:hypothetical protein
MQYVCGYVSGKVQRYKDLVQHLQLPMPKLKKSQKSVSFQTLEGESASDALAADIPKLIHHLSLLLVPFHLPIILALLYGGLLANPGNMLLKSIPTLMVAQVAYGTVVSRHGSVMKGTRKETSRKSSSRKAEAGSGLMLSVSAAVISLLMSVPLFAVIILFGAPLYDFVWQTYLLSVHLSLIIFFPVLVSFRLDLAKFLAVFEAGSGDQFYQQLYENQLILAAIGALVGAWFGVLPIPLDWDREWQQWPLTLLVGGYVGTFLGSILGLAISYGRNQNI